VDKKRQKMDRKRVAFGIEIVLAVLAMFTVPVMAGPNTMFFTNYSGDTSPGGISYVELWLNITDPYGDDPTYGFCASDINITVDKLIGNAVDCNQIPGHPWDAQCDCNMGLQDGWWIVVRSSVSPPPPIGMDPGVYPVMNLTIEGNNPGVMDLDFNHELPRNCNMYDSNGMPYPSQIWEDGTFTCVGSPETAETFEKELVVGWNLISLPLTPINSSTSAVLGNDTIEYDAVYRYNANSKLFEDVTTGTMDPGIGYFVNVTTAGTWSYEGTPPYNSMSIDLKQGLNMIGWLNCSKQISGNLTSIAGKYNYNARWNNGGYEVYEPQAPEVFNDFFDMKRGEGYWIAAKEDCTLTVSCSG